MSERGPGPKVFLSHRKEDRSAAALIRNVLCDVGFPEGSIFDFTGGEETDRVSGGSPVTKEIARACNDCSLFILIYTVKDEKWDYCLFEAGLALNANQLASGEATDTRIVVFQCTDHVPEALRDNLTVRLEEQSLREFLWDLTTKDDFIPGYPPKYPNPPRAWSTTIESIAKQLLGDLNKIVGARDTRFIDVWRWDWLKLRLEADAERHLTDLLKHHQAEHREAKSAGTTAMVDPVWSHPDVMMGFLEKSIVVEYFGSGLDHFALSPTDKAYDSTGRIFVYGPEQPFTTLCARWSAALGHSEDIVPRWAREIIGEIAKALLGVPAAPQRVLMQSADKRFPGDWYFPILNHVRRAPGGGVEFIIYMYRLERDLPWLNEAGIQE